MKEQLTKLLTRLRPALTKLRHYLAFATILLFILVYASLVLRINNLSGKGPTDEQIQAKSQTIKRPKVDQQTLDKLQQLQDQNIQVKALFDQARQNPFAE